MADRLMLCATIGMGHILPATELAKLFLAHGYAVDLAIVDMPQSPKSNETLARLSASNPSLSFHLIPAEAPATGTIGFFQALKDANPALLSLARSLPSLRAMVIDFLCADGLDVARELGIPGYFFYTSGASDIAVFLHLPVLVATMTESFKDMGDTLLHFPGLRPFPASCIPGRMSDRNGESFKMAIENYKSHAQGDGIIVNSFNWLEANALRALKDGLTLPGQRMPLVYAVGPLVAAEKLDGKHECLAWLDKQPKQSVVFLCFGSMGAFPVEQLKEIAVGLERSGLRFLWVVHSPLENPKYFWGPRVEKELDELLPEGFMARTEGRGMVVKSWVPQLEVLRHEATGAFVTHCGWNSILEGVTSGVPMLCWPLYAEQKLNKVFMVQEMEIGWEMVKEGGDDELVKAEEVEAKVRLVMESEEGKKLRERLATAKEQAAEALREGGLSQQEFAELVTYLKCGKKSLA